MAAQLQIDQNTLSPTGTPGKARTDGLDGGQLVTLTNTGAGTTTAFRFLDVPAEDTTAVGSLAVTGDPKVWTFSPTASVYGSYLIELIEDLGLGTEVRERRIFGIRTPNFKLLAPALNEVADRTASLINNGAAQIQAADNNADDNVNVALGARPYAGWWRSLTEVIDVVDSLSGGGGGGVPLSTIWFVDVGGTSPSPNGRIGSAFLTIQDAIDAAATGDNIVLTPGDYSGQTSTIVGKELTITGWQSGPYGGFNSSGPGAISSDSVLQLVNLFILGNIVTTADLYLFNCSQTSGQISVTGANIFACGPNATRSGSANCDLRSVQCDGAAYFDGIAMTSGVLDAFQFAEILFQRCLIDAIVDVDIQGRIYNSQVLQSGGFTGNDSNTTQLEFDYFSNQGNPAGSYPGCLPNKVIGKMPFCTKSVTVPAIGVAGTLAYATVSVAGTELAGIDTNDFVVANPTAQLSAAGAGRGAYLNCRVSGLNTIELAFHGILAGGASNFYFVRLTKAILIP